jgi:hypothetical protein
MNIEPVLAGLLRFGEDEWIGLWVIADDVAQDLGVEDWAENLQATLALVRELLRRGYRAGDSPLENDAVHFAPWPNQDAEAVVDFIRRQWMRRADLPSWGDSPWFAAPRFCRLDG